MGTELCVVSVCVTVQACRQQEKVVTGEKKGNGMGRHTTLCGYALEKVLSDSLILPLEWFDEDNAKIGLCLLCIETLNPEHCHWMPRLCCDRSRSNKGILGPGLKIAETLCGESTERVEGPYCRCLGSIRSETNGSCHFVVSTESEVRVARVQAESQGVVRSVSSGPSPPPKPAPAPAHRGEDIQYSIQKFKKVPIPLLMKRWTF